ncbi:4-hydroxybenzoate polyprenyltransferase [Gilliamella sp. Choc4-2]|jgi:4-hydroxybenzoate polyprenyltransferase|uniref:4-hydroxybenzoate octaprenyltransferase n=1 Tax=unclassified Gilliamella TaxID=2685620 RepID=UPI0004DD69F6|nr:4-hydroxybenzoate octaprenyltransferase [Gilliamella apicola]KFA58312.1 4-hydroxybenzoate polyprenyltransferase [Gilliamella apicola]OCG31572.1 4-hydroxybenzoate polyprenyltransferase [Gilliamella apicola]OCG42481.1 4-hydroxybenzoate polyprenyltransferase [Gilliamella apicola]OCG54059.1 4-hydroxybenzoate polyprenyltransferase [Gilliamella apicola]OCG63548.1 4-hydroxybenzoate polyprenyltransferase [Gilliamella apicola]
MLAYLQLMRLDRPIGTLLLLWPTLWAINLAGHSSIDITVVFIFGVFVMRSAGCVVNDYADRHFDAYVERTKNRPLARGALAEKNALWTLFVLLLIAFCLLLTLNKLSWLIGCFALLTALIYPFMKRYTHLPQLTLGIAFSWGIPMVYAATTEQFPFICWLLFFTNICWTIAYDTEYAMVDRNDDIKIGIKSTAILFGRYDKLIIGLLQIITIISLIVIGLLSQLSFIYYWSLLFASILFIYQQWLIKNRERNKCFSAFMNNNYVGFIIFLGLLFV